ncbi:MAG: type pilus assembly protein PilM [Gaiellaceae bacterium]|nr:type pilus assembly protein PilM [Gaiellaceae bacterium]
MAENQSIWKKEISLRKAPPKAEPVAAAESVDAPQAEESVPFWKKEIRLSGGGAKAPKQPKPPKAEKPAKQPKDKKAKKVKAEKPAGEKTSIWKRDVSLGKKQPAPEPVIEPVADALQRVVAAAPDPAEAPEPVETPVAEPDGWAAPETLPPAPEPVAEPAAAEFSFLTVDTAEVAAPAPVPAPAPVIPEPAVELPAAPVQEVHPPVPAADLPPLPEEAKPFWKRDLGKPKAAKQPKAEKPKREKKPKAVKEPKADRTAKPKRAPKVKSEKKSRDHTPKKLVGLKIGASQIAAARVSNNGSIELHSVARETLEDGIVVGGELRNPEALSAALKEFFKKHKLPRKGIRLGIANNRIGVRAFDIVGIDDPKQLANAIHFRAQEALPIPIDEAVLDYQVLSEHTDEDGVTTRKILLVVAYRELIDRYVAACKKAGLTLAGIDLEAFALLRALAPPQDGTAANSGAALVAVSVGHERSTFAVSDGRVCDFTRVLDWGGSALSVAIARILDVTPSEAEPVKRQLSLLEAHPVDGLTDEQLNACREAVQKQIQSFARELVSSLQFYQNQPGSLGIGEIALTGGTAHLPGLADELQRLIGVSVRIGDPLARVRVNRKMADPEQVGSLAVAIGLAIDD